MGIFQDLVIGGPGSSFSDQTATFSVSGPVTNAVQVYVQIRNAQTGASVGANLSIPYGSQVDISKTAAFIDVKLNDLLAAYPDSNLLGGNVLCGSGVGLTVQAYAVDASSNLHQSGVQGFTGIRSPCKCTRIDNVFTTLAALKGCMGVDGEVGIQGKLFEVTCGGGIPSPYVNLGGAVSIGITDPSTGQYYEYVRAATDNTGTFSAGFKIKNRPEVASLVPFNGSKMLNLTAFFPGSLDHTPSPPSTTAMTVSGNQGPVCDLGALVLDQNYESLPATETTVHRITQSFTGKLLSTGDMARAADIAENVRNGIINAGAHPIRIQVYRGPDVPIPLFYGFGSITLPVFNVVSRSWGSPVAIIIIAGILLTIIVILALTVIALYFVDDIVSKGGGPVLQTVAVAATVITVAVAGVAGYYLYKRSKAGGSK